MISEGDTVIVSSGPPHYRGKTGVVSKVLSKRNRYDFMVELDSKHYGLAFHDSELASLPH